jgi:chitinase
MGVRRLRLAAMAAVVVAAIGTTGLAAVGAAAQANLLANPGFETGNLSGWSCSPLDSAATSPVHSGSYALAGAVSGSDDAQCSQSVSVQPSTAYTLSGWVQGPRRRPRGPSSPRLSAPVRPPRA